MQFDIDVGVLLSCISVTTPPLNLCVLRKMVPLTSTLKEPCVNKFDCPLLNLTKDLYVIPAPSVIKPISIVHSCTESCKFVIVVNCVQIEREHIVCSKFVLLHVQQDILLQHILYFQQFLILCTLLLFVTLYRKL